MASVPMEILMVDDDREDIYLTKRLLDDAKLSNDFLYEEESDALFRRLEEIYESRPGGSNLFILLDINMPCQDGFETLKKLKSDDRFKNIPVVMLSTSDDEGNIFESFELGADGYIVKPMALDELMAAVSTIERCRYQITC